MKKIKYLLNSLTQREKSYFSNMFKQSKEKYFYQLYLAFQKQPDIDVSTVKKDFKQIPQIHYELNHLYRQILRSLIIYRYNSSQPEYNLIKVVQIVQVLIDKGDFTEAKKTIKRGKKIALVVEDYVMLLKFVNLEESITFSHIETLTQEKIEKLEKESEEIMAVIRKNKELTYLRSNLIRLNYKFGFIIPKDKIPVEYINHPLLKEESSLKSLKSKIVMLFCKAILFMYLGQYRESLDTQSKIVDLICENNGIFVKEDEIRAMFNYLNICLICNDLNAFALMEEKLLNAFVEKPSSSFKFYYLALKLRYDSYTCDFDGVRNNIPKVKDFLLKNKGRLKSAQRDELYAHLAIGFVFLKDYSEAQNLLQSWEISGHESYRYAFVRTLSIGVHLGLKNYRLLRSEVSAYLKTLSRKNELNSVYKLFGAFIRKTATLESLDQAVMIKYYNEFEVLYKQNDLRRYFVEFNFLYWLKNLIDRENL